MTDDPLRGPVPDGAMPRAILVGDSHVLALQQGCEALGIPVAMLKSGGIHWNAGKIRVFAPRRRRTPVMPKLESAVRALERQLSVTDVFDSGLPVIASVGFHVGHLARGFGGAGHVAGRPPAGLSVEETDGCLFASQAVLEAFVNARRARHFKLLSHIAGKCRLTVVLPPRAPKNEGKIRFRHNIEALTSCIAGRLTRMGLEVYDPNAEFAGDGAPLPWSLVNEDGFHGTPEYGLRVVERLVARGALETGAAPARLVGQSAPGGSGALSGGG